MNEYDPLLQVSSMSDNLFKYEIVDILKHNYIYKNYEEANKIIQSKLKKYFMIKTLTLIGSQKFKGSLDKIDKLYGTKFSYEETNHNIFVPNKEIKFQLPVENIFIPNSTQIINSSKLNKIYNEKNFEIWHNGTNKFKMPRVLINIIANNNKIKKSIKNYMSFLLFSKCFKYKSSVTLYYSNVASSYFDFTVNKEYDVKLSINSYSDTVDNVVSTFINLLKNFDITDKEFKNIFREFKNNLKNNLLNPPYVQGGEYLEEKSNRKYFTIYEMLDNIDQVDINTVMSAKKWLFEKCSITSYVYGNINSSNAINLMSNFKIFVDKNYQHIKNKNVILLNNGDEEIYIKKIKNKNENDSFINIFFEIDRIIPNETKHWDKKIAKIYLTHLILEEKFFNKLRSTEQTGYIVQSGVTTLGSISEFVFGTLFMIQSSKFNPVQLKDKIKKFIEDSIEFITNLNDDIFEEYKKSLINQYNIPKYNIYEEFYDNWSHIAGGDYQFNMNELLVNAINKIDTNDIVKFYHKYFLNKKTRKIRIVELFKH